MLYIDGDGRVLKKIIGLHTPEDLIAIGKSVKQPARSRGL